MKSNVTLLFLLLSVSAFSQDSSFQLNDYKYRTPGVKALAVGFNFSGSYSKLENENSNNTRSRNLDLGPVNLSYTRVVSTETRQHWSALTLNPAASFSGSSINGNEAHVTHFDPSFSWYRNDRFYRSKTWFLEVGNEFTTSYTAQSTKETLNRSTSKHLDVQENIVFGMGKGRIENVQDAQMALYLLQDLSAQHLLNRAPTAGEARTLAQLITDINNKRVFDFRRRRVYELTRLDSFFRSSGLAPQTDIRHFTTLNDNWALAFNPNRFSGANWYLRVRPGVGYRRFAFDHSLPTPGTSSKTDVTFLNLSPVIGYEKYRPLNLQWQQNVGVSLDYHFSRAKLNTEATDPGGINKTSEITNNGHSTLNLSYGMGYYPNNRTQISGGLDIINNFYRNRDFELLTYLNLSAQYFIGYRTYLIATAYARYNQRERHVNSGSQDFRDLSAGFSVSLSHVVF